MRCATCGSTNIEGEAGWPTLYERDAPKGWWLQGNGWLVQIGMMHDSHLLNAHRLAMLVRLGLRGGAPIAERKVRELLMEIAHRGLQPIPVTDPPA